MAAEPQLTPACELAFAVARQGTQSAPVVEPPAALRNFLQSPQPSRRALRAAHRALDGDAGFRRRVADQAATDAYVGRAGWLFLHRPDGWDLEFEELTCRFLPGPAVEPDARRVDGPAGEATGGQGPEPAGVAEQADGAEQAEGPATVEAGSGLEREVHALRTLVESLMAEGGILAGATIRHLEEQVGALARERDDLAGELSTTAADRDRALALAAGTSDRLAATEARLADATARRVAVEDRLTAALAAQAAAVTAHQALLADLADQLAVAGTERDALAGELERIAAHADQARELFEEAARRAADELQRTLEPSLRAAGHAARGIGDAVHQARMGTERLGDDLVASASAVDRWTAQVEGPAVGVTPVPDDGDLLQVEGDELFPGPGVGGDEPGDGFAEDAWDLSKDLSEALAPYLSDLDRQQPGPLSGSDPACPRWLDDGGPGDGHEVERREVWVNPREGDAAVRQAVPVPDELAGDPLATARFLASLPDVVLVVDGDAVGRLGWPTLSVAEQRDALVSYLGDLAGTAGAAADVVFSGEAGDETTLPPSDLVRVRLTAPAVGSGEAAIALVASYPVDWPAVVVTDDPEVEARAGAIGAATLPAGGLLDLFIAP